MSREFAPEPAEKTKVHTYRTTIELGEPGQLSPLLEEHSRSQFFSLYSGCDEDADSPISHLEVYCCSQSKDQPFELGAELKFDYSYAYGAPSHDIDDIDFLDINPLDLPGLIEKKLLKHNVFTQRQIHESAKPSLDHKAVFELSDNIFAALSINHDETDNMATLRLKTAGDEATQYLDEQNRDTASTSPKERIDALVKFCEIIAHTHDAISDLYSSPDFELERHIDFNLPGKGRSVPKPPESALSMPFQEILPENEVTFDDIAGYEAIKEKLLDLALVYEHPEIAENIGLTSTHGILLYGPPGTGKTTLLKAFANELSADCVELPVSDVIDKYVGESAKKVDGAFAHIKENPFRQVVIMDEFDSIGASSRQSSSAERVDAVNRLKEHIVDITENYPNILLTAATNDLDRIDKSLIRPGRMHAMEVPLPSELDRRNIWSLVLGRVAAQAHFNKLNDPNLPTLSIDTDVDAVTLAQHSEGLVGANFKEVLNVIRRQRLREYLKSGDMPNIKQADLLNEISKARYDY